MLWHELKETLKFLHVDINILATYLEFLNKFNL